MSARPALKFKLRRGNAFRESRQVSENLELFKKLDPRAQFQWERISSAVQPRHSLALDIALSVAVKGHWTQEGYEGPLDTRGQTVFRPSAYVDLQSLGLTGGEEKSDLSFVSTPRPPSRIGPIMQVFHQSSGSPDQAHPDPRCAYVGCRPVYGSSVFGFPRVI